MTSSDSTTTQQAHATKIDMVATARAAQGDDVRSFTQAGAIRLIAPAKVNLYLDIGQKRPDNYHDAISIMHALTLHDVLYMKQGQAQTPGLQVTLTCHERDGIAPLNVEPEQNIVSKAIRTLATRLGRTGDEEIIVRLEKHIPAQAGLGGGSSNAAAALLGAACMWGMSADDPRIEEVARELGADVAFFLHGGCACFAGVGDEFLHELQPMGSYVVLVKPEGGVSTAEAYRTFDEHPTSIKETDRQAALAARRAHDVPLCNNLVPASEQLLPVLADIRMWLTGHRGVQAALMSGSGSAVFALCDTFEDATRIAAEAHTRGWWARATMFGPARAAVVPHA